MLLITHIVFALSSIPLMMAAVANEALGVIKNKSLLPKLSAISFAGLLGTGTALIITQHLAVIGGCIDGLLYLSALAVLFAIFRKVTSKTEA